MKITFDPRYTKFHVINKAGYRCVYKADTYDEAISFVKENWVEGEGFEIEIQAVTRWETVTLCEITDDDPLDEVDPDNREIIKAVLTFLAKQN